VELEVNLDYWLFAQKYLKYVIMELENDQTKEDRSQKPRNIQDQLSPEMREILEEEIKEAEIRTVIDAWAEVGVDISRSDAIELIRQDKENNLDKNLEQTKEDCNKENGRT
jgi:hypothetical protein